MTILSFVAVLLISGCGINRAQDQVLSQDQYITHEQGKAEPILIHEIFVE